MTEPKAVQLARWMSQNNPNVVHKAEKIDKHVKDQWRKTQQHAPTKRMEMLLDVVDLEMTKITAPLRLPCRAGCNHCCTSQTIGIHHEEMVFLAKHMKKHWTPAQWKWLTEKTQQIKPTNDIDNNPCVFLGERGCSVYKARPMGCRPYQSLSEQACREKLTKKDTPISSPVLPHSISQSYHECVQFDGVLYEINSLIQRVHAQNDWDKWCQGGVVYPDLVLDLSARIKAFEQLTSEATQDTPSRRTIEIALVGPTFELHGDSDATV